MHFNFKGLLQETEIWNDLDIPIYRRLYLSLRELIQNKSLTIGSQLPPSRVFSKDLEISRSTVLKAFDLLCFDRFVVSKKGLGYFVAYTDTEQKGHSKIKNSKNKYPKLSKRAKLFQRYSYLSTDNFSKKSVAFRPGLPPLDQFPFQKWKNLSNTYWREATPTNLSYAPSQGLENLQINIATYLRMYRNINCNHKNIIITSGSLHSLYLIASAIVNKGDKIVMENPTFPRAYNLFKSLKASIIPCNLDNEGIQIDLIKDAKTKLIYTTPSNQYPIGVKMSKNRRNELLNWASANHSIIIEDDYDHEFSNWNSPLPSLFSLDNEDRVIYLGTFNKLLHPSLRVGYMIVPDYLIDPIKAIYEQSSRFIPVSTQTILSNFIYKNYLNIHIRQVIEKSVERKQLFEELTKATFDIEKNFDGLHIIGRIKNSIDDQKAYKLLLENGVIAYPLSNYYITEEKKQGLVMGFSSVNKKVMKEKTDVINRVLKDK